MRNPSGSTERAEFESTTAAVSVAGAKPAKLRKPPVPPLWNYSRSHDPAPPGSQHPDRHADVATWRRAWRSSSSATSGSTSGEELT
jgi:hypothetical protein